jgi:hypothetical protein
MIQKVHVHLTASLHKILRLFGFFELGRRAGIAVATAMMTPMLLAITGLSVDVGYWYQQQESLQSAADAAALAVANAYSANSSITSAGESSFAVAAANAATNNQFGFASSGSRVVRVTASIGTTEDTFTATVAIPRGSFFSPVSGEGVFGVEAGTQSATAKAAYGAQTFSPCVYAGSNIQEGTGGQKISATNCGVYAGTSIRQGNNSDSLIATGGVDTPESSSSYSGNDPGYVGTSASATGASDPTLNAPAVADPLASLNSHNAVLWNQAITVSAAPSSATTAVNISSDLNSAWNPYRNATTGTYCDTTYETYTLAGGYCLSDANVLGTSKYYTGISYGFNGYTMLANTTGGETVIEGGLDGQTNSGDLSLDDSTYYISGGMDVNLGHNLYFGTGSTTMNVTVTGGMTIGESGNAVLYPGNYTISQAAAGSTPSNYAISEGSVDSMTMEGGTYLVNGGMSISQGTPQTYMWSGLYDFEGAMSNYCGSPSSCSNGAFFGNQGYITFGTATTPVSSSGPGTCGSTPSTWYFNGGLVISGDAKVLFCPGIYYIKNGYLTIESYSGSIVGMNVTFVLEGTAGIDFTDTGSNATFTAPTTNCVQPNLYPLASQTGTGDYDGTGGKGICGISFYQERGDTAADTIALTGATATASTTINGSFYAPSASLTVNSASSRGLTIISSGQPALDVLALNDTNSGLITFTENNQPSGSSTRGAPLLVQ